MAALSEVLHRVMGSADKLKLKCGNCGHRREWTRDQAIALYGPGAAPYDIMRNSKCGRCDCKNQVIAWI